MGVPPLPPVIDNTRQPQMSDMIALLNDLSYIPPNNELNEPIQEDIGETSNEPTQAKRNEFEELYASANEELYPGCDYVTRLDFMAKFTYFKVKGKLTDSIFNEILEFFQHVFPTTKGYKLPPSYYAIKKTFKNDRLGLVKCGVVRDILDEVSEVPDGDYRSRIVSGPMCSICSSKCADVAWPNQNREVARSLSCGIPFSPDRQKKVVFRSLCKSIGLRSVIRFDAQELKKVIWYVLHNSLEIDTYRSQFKSKFPNKDMKEEFPNWFGSQTTGPFGDGGGDDRPPFTPHIPTDMLGFASLTKAKAPVKANLGGRKATTQFNLTPHMQSQRWADINAGIQQHLQKLYNTNKASLKATHWVINPETGTYDVETIRQGRPESITPADWDAQIAIWNDPEYRCEPETREYAVAIVTSTPSRDAHRLISEEMVRLAGSRLQQRVGWCPTTDEENNAIGSKGQASGGTFPELVGYLPGRARDVLNHRPLPQMPRTTPAMSKSLKRRTVSTKQSLGKVARERIPGELSPSNYPGRHVARDEYPQRHVAREGVKMSMGIVWNMLNQQKNMISTAATDD
ncbi:hypothetical protein Tco_1328833 [Tanacetum coccineum]